MKTSKITLANIMKNAWAIAKEAAKKFGGSARQYLSGSLKAAWLEIKSTEKTIEEVIISLGGKVWQKNGMNRIYMTCDVYRVLRNSLNLGYVAFSDSTNKIFFDVNERTVMRSYKAKKPSIEIKF